MGFESDKSKDSSPSLVFEIITIKIVPYCESYIHTDSRSRCFDRASPDFLPARNRNSNKKPITTPLFLYPVFTVPEFV